MMNQMEIATAGWAGSGPPLRLGTLNPKFSEHRKTKVGSACRD